MKPPYVVFTIPPTRHEADMLISFGMHGGPRWSSYVFNRFPELKAIYSSRISKNEKIQRTSQAVRKYVKNNKNTILHNKEKFQQEWDKINDNYLVLLSTLFETSLPRRKTMKAYVSIVPIFPRFLDTWSFNVGYKFEHMRQIAAHEILHFMYFKKWMEVFPKTKRKELESPADVWMLSELLANVIINKTSEIQDLIQSKDGGYEEFASMKMKGKLLTTCLGDIYTKHRKNKTTFESFLKDAHALFLEYKK